MVWCGMDDATEALPDALDGSVLLPGDPGTTRPGRSGTPSSTGVLGVIVRCASVRDVVTAVRTAREHGLEIGIRCGGHSAAGHAVPTAG